MLTKILITILLTLFLFAPSPVSAESKNTPPAQILIINQVRGGENCCQPGSLKNLKEQIYLQQKLHIPAYFLLRYDVLSNPSFIKELKNALNSPRQLIKIGALIEITPSLAKDSAVKYPAADGPWQEAQNAFTIGYSIEDRKKLSYQLFNRFHEIFAFYPQLSGGWMIDTPTLNYLQKKFHLKAHLITREQWGADTYHLYGGPPHYPYPASSAWAFMPSYSNAKPLLILRQTVTDPLRNYADSTSSFTSQANDYLNGGRDFSYFKSLLDQALFQQPIPPGFALLGLENSMPDKYQQEFSRQLKYTHKLYQDGRIIYPSLDELINTWTKQKLTAYQGKDLIGPSNNQAVWISAPGYRLRLLIVKQNISFTDIRLFNPQLKDPYTVNKAVKEGYWIIPYLIDGSLNQKAKKPKRSFWLKAFGPPPPQASLINPKPDLFNQPSRLKLPKMKKGGNIVWKQKTEGGRLSFSYQSSSNKKIDVEFDQKKIIIKPAGKKDITYQDQNPPNHPISFKQVNDGFLLSWNINNQPSHQLRLKCQSDQCILSFKQNLNLITKAYLDQYPFLFPERRPRPIDVRNTVLYVHNRYAIAGRNPVRVIFIPKDKFGLPIIAKEEIKLKTTPPVNLSNQSLNRQKQFDQIIDLTSNHPLSTRLSIKANQQILKSTTVYLSPNCKQDPRYCLSHPLQAVWYLKAIFYDKIRSKFFGEQQ